MIRTKPKLERPTKCHAFMLYLVITRNSVPFFGREKGRCYYSWTDGRTDITNTYFVLLRWFEHIFGIAVKCKLNYVFLSNETQRTRLLKLQEQAIVVKLNTVRVENLIDERRD
jgi:hypothetical protein